MGRPRIERRRPECDAHGTCLGDVSRAPTERCSASRTRCGPLTVPASSRPGVASNSVGTPAGRVYTKAKPWGAAVRNSAKATSLDRAQPMYPHVGQSPSASLLRLPTALAAPHSRHVTSIGVGMAVSSARSYSPASGSSARSVRASTEAPESGLRPRVDLRDTAPLHGEGSSRLGRTKLADPQAHPRPK